MTDREKHTPYPTPWTLEYSEGDHYIRDALGETVACDMAYYPWIQTEPMPQIVRAVNNFDALVADMKHILEYWNGNHNERAMVDALEHILDVAETAVKRAEA